MKCRPPRNRDPNEFEIMRCSGYLMKTINEMKPEVIFTLGKVATQFIFRRYANRGFTIMLSSPWDKKVNIACIPLYHPAWLVYLRGKKEFEDSKNIYISHIMKNRDLIEKAIGRNLNE